MGSSYDSKIKYIKYNFKIRKNNLKLKYLNTQCHSLNLLKYFFLEKLKIKHKNIDKNSGEGLVISKQKKFKYFTYK